MPLFRKSSSSSRTENDAAEQLEQTQVAKPSFLRRLSRRNSRSQTEAHTPTDGANLVQPNKHSEHVSVPSTPQRPSIQTSQKSASSGSAVEVASPQNGTSVTGDGLSKEDIKSLFFGAPQFMLEKGKHGHAFPQAFFPWNNDLEISDLQDRRYIKHESFALATLHAHLPIPDELNWKPSNTGPQKREEAWKRPMFDLGIFEVPNMLYIDGRIPGTVGLRYFLELPIAESQQTAAKAKIKEHAIPGEKAGQSPALETFRSLEHAQGHAKIGKHAPMQDRLELIRDGPHGWKRVGVRNIDTSTVLKRLSTIGSWHDEVLAEGWQVSVLDKQDCATLYEQLFEDFLYLPDKNKDNTEDPRGLKVQIEALVKVLTTPGAWIDFSLVEWRIRLGQVLWELSPHQRRGNDGTDPSSGGERRWLIIQILLAIELLIRLDAALRLGIAKRSERFHLSGDEIHHFNKLRNPKVDWDLVVARRFLDTIDVKRSSVPLSPSESTQGYIRPAPTHAFSSFRHKHEQAEPSDTLPTWDCALLPRQAKTQAEAIVRFARLIEWPSTEKLEERLTSKLCNSTLSIEQLFATPIHSGIGGSGEEEAGVIEHLHSKSGPDWTKRARVILQPAAEDRVGGWLSRSWLTGLVIPSEAAHGFLMTSVLENDVEALTKLGKVAYLHGGFILDGRSWWSMFCVVGRVLAPSKGGSQCMGWINTPTILPIDEDDRSLPNGWLDVSMQAVPNPRDGWRIYDGVKLAQESSPLGIGHGKVMAGEFGMITDKVFEKTETSTMSLISVSIETNMNTSAGLGGRTASANFDLQSTSLARDRRCKLYLLHDVYFVAAYACRLPHGHAVPSTDASPDRHPEHKHSEHLPAHPLHKSYKYTVKGVLDLGDSLPPNPSQHDSAVWILDARDEATKDIYARAWCAQVGVNALVAKAGKTCLSCSIREAKAIEVGLIIRVGTRSSY